MTPAQEAVIAVLDAHAGYGVSVANLAKAVGRKPSNLACTLQVLTQYGGHHDGKCGVRPAPCNPSDPLPARAFQSGHKCSIDAYQIQLDQIENEAVSQEEGVRTLTRIAWWASVHLWFSQSAPLHAYVGDSPPQGP